MEGYFKIVVNLFVLQDFGRVVGSPKPKPEVYHFNSLLTG
jgi:hypothetical protein